MCIERENGVGEVKLVKVSFAEQREAWESLFGTTSILLPTIILPKTV
jgi:hypothetical protein